MNNSFDWFSLILAALIGIGALTVLFGAVYCVAWLCRHVAFV
jgi:hypothetical protein